jgi:hypothetical protein
VSKHDGTAAHLVLRLAILDDGEVGMPGEVDALATVGDGVVAVLLWRHADDQYATATTDTVVTLRLERIPSTLPA